MMERHAHPAISIIIPVYNTQMYLRRCLDSAINQTFFNIEVICINDGSTDKSRDILDEYAGQDPRIVMVDKCNGGLSSARNAGLDIARGKYILFLDSDDYMDATLCACVFEKAESLEAEVVFFNARHFTRERVFKKTFFNYPNIEGAFCPLEYPLVMMQVSAWNRLYQRELIKDMRFVKNLLFEDQPFSAEVNIIAKRAVIVDQPLYYYRADNPTAITINETHCMGIFDSFDALKKMLHQYGNKKELYELVFAAGELVNYKNRIHLLPPRHRYLFFKEARRRLAGVRWPLLIANCKKYDATYWPWRFSDRYFVFCLRWTGFWAYLPAMVLGGRHNLKYAIFNCFILGSIIEWLYAFIWLGRSDQKHNFKKQRHNETINRFILL